jgi:hypothetical protein
MEDKDFDELIEELRELKIREREIISALDQASRTGRVQTRHETEARPHEGQAQVPYGFRQGDRVRITNKVRKPATAGPSWTEARERSAVVTKIVPDQVHILTDNGTRTWRAPNNLQIQRTPP